MNKMPLYDDNLDANLKSRLGAETGFSWPDGYFEELSQSVQLRLGNIQEREITEVPKHIYPFTEPSHYFENLNTSIQNKINTEDTVVPLFSAVDSRFETPADYFEQSKYHIISETSGTKSFGDQEHHFEVKEGYFEKSKQHILAQTTQAKSAKQNRPVLRRVQVRSLLRYAAAVAVAFVLGYLSHTKQNIVVYNNHGQLSAPVIIEDITYEELQAALAEEDLSNEDLMELANIQSASVPNNNSIKSHHEKVKSEKIKNDKEPTSKQIEQYIIDNAEDINTDEL